MANNFSISILTTDQLRALTERLLKEKQEAPAAADKEASGGEA